MNQPNELQKELVILVGMPGAGKTHYCQAALGDYTRISQEAGPRYFPRLLRAYERLLARGVERIVIDRTNPAGEIRRMFADLARAAGYRVKIVYFDVPRNVCERRIGYRQNHPTLKADKMHQAIGRYEKYLDVPTEDECDELIIIRQGE